MINEGQGREACRGGRRWAGRKMKTRKEDDEEEKRKKIEMRENEDRERMERRNVHEERG